MRSFSSNSLKAVSPLGLKERERNYDMHIKKIIQIEKAQNQKRILASQQRIASNLRKSKQANRKFRESQQNSKRQHEDMKMIKTLVQITKKPRIKTQMRQEKHERHSKVDKLPGRSVSKDNVFKKELISTENVRLARSIMDNSVQVKQYKKKMRTQIDQYLKLRNHIQKFRPSQTQRTERPKRPSSTANDLLSLIKQKTQQIRRNQSRVNIANVTDQSKESEIAKKEQELML